MARPEQVDVWIGLDVGKENHFAEVLDDAGERIFARGVANDEAALEALLDRAGKHGTVGLVIDQPGSIAQLTLAVAARRQVPVAYVPGLVMRRAADLYPGEAKTDKRDAFIIADTGRTRRRQVHWLDAGSDELLGQLRVLNGFDIDLAADQTRLANRLRDALTSVSPALERALGKRLAQAGVRDLLTRYPTLTALRNAGRAQITKVIKTRSPRLAGAVTDAVLAALDAQSVTVPAEAATGRVIAELMRRAGPGPCPPRRSGRSEIEESSSHPFGELLLACRDRSAHRVSDPGRDRRRRFADSGGRLAFLQQALPGDPPVRQVHQRRVPKPARQPPAEERHVPRRLRVPARPGVQGVLRPQARRRQTPQRRP